MINLQTKDIQIEFKQKHLEGESKMVVNVGFVLDLTNHIAAMPVIQHCGFLGRKV